jgi:hypothetical protein
MKLIFDKQGNLLLTTSGAIPSSHDNDDYVIAELAEGEHFDFNYNYVINEEGFATKGDLKEIDLEEVARVEAEIAATKYKRQRASEYPPIGDQLDALFHAGAFTPEMTSLIQAVKDKYPKAN